MASPYRLQSSHFNSRPHGGRPTLRSLLHSAPAFQLTPSRRATVSAPGTGLSYVNFNSRPHGGRRSSARLFPSGLIFQLTPSRRATKIRKANFNDILISTHALTEGDKLQRLTNFYHFHFNSRPHGGRLSQYFLLFPQHNFNSRPHGGRRLCSYYPGSEAVYFNSRPHGGRPKISLIISLPMHFNSRPHGGRRQI